MFVFKLCPDIQLTDSLLITAFGIDIEGSIVMEPKKGFLSGLTSKSRFIFQNVLLKNPAQGALFTRMTNSEFKNITIEGRCECDLACTKEDFKLHQDICKTLGEKTMRSIQCQVSTKIFHNSTKNCILS